MSDNDVESTLREIRALAHATPLLARDSNATAHARPPLGLTARVKHLLRRIFAAAGYWFAQGKVSHASEMSQAAGLSSRERLAYEQRLQTLEQEQVTLRQAAIELSETIERLDRAHRAAALRIEQLEAERDARVRSTAS